MRELLPRALDQPDDKAANKLSSFPERAVRMAVRQQGYNPDFDIALDFGIAGERLVMETLGRTVECKRDTFRSGLWYVEFECSGKPSGIRTTKAEVWCLVRPHQDSMILVATTKLRRLAEQAIREGRVMETRNSKSPTRGAMVKIADLYSE